MKRILVLTLSSLFFLFASVSFANNKTNMDANWTCTTNASSSSVESDTQADKKMSESHKSAADAFSFAAKNCRDCTKITCESNND